MLFSVFCCEFDIEVKGEHMARLQPLEWLVDEIMNFYMKLLQVRGGWGSGGRLPYPGVARAWR